MKNFKIEIVIKYILIICFAFGIYFQNNIGLADNGDFERLAHFFSLKVSGNTDNLLISGPNNRSAHLFQFWIPNWSIEWKPFKLKQLLFTSSSFLLWLPGFFLNKLIVSDNIFSLPLISFFPKILLFAILLLLFKWIEVQENYKKLLFFTIGVPVILMLTTTDYISYFNTFYQEPAALIFLFLFLFSLISLKTNPSKVRLAYSLILLLLVVISKTAYFYWSFIGVIFAVSIWSAQKKLNVYRVMTYCIILIILFASITFLTAGKRYIGENSYHSLFYGILLFSNKPAEHLERLGMKGAERCINLPAYSKHGGRDCFRQYARKMSYLNTIKVVYNEPMTMVRMTNYVLSVMQDISLDYLGKFSYDNPLSKVYPYIKPHNSLNTQENRVWTNSSGPIFLNIWSAVKYRFFPIGYWLIITIAVFMCLFLRNLKDCGTCLDLSIIGLLVTIAMCIDMIVNIIGDGKYEIIKHLFLSNLLFDIALLAFLNVAIINLYRKKYFKRSSMSQDINVNIRG